MSRVPTPPDPGDPVADELRRLCGCTVEPLPISGAGSAIAARKKQLSLLPPLTRSANASRSGGPCSARGFSGAPRRPAGRSWWLISPCQDAAGRSTPARRRKLGWAAVLARLRSAGAARPGVLNLFRTRRGPLCGSASALARIRAHACAENRRRLDVALAVIARELSFKWDEKSP